MNRIREVAAESRQLPEPDAEAKAHSEMVLTRVREEIAEAGGMIPFEQYMATSLYAPGLGYYAAGASKFGEEGDFVTAPEISSLFSRCLARQCQQVLGELGGGDILEYGAGRGVMAADILLELERLDALPDNYFIMEVSAQLQVRQRETIEQKAPQLVDKVTWLDGLEGKSISGVVLANEVLDAMPVTIFKQGENGLEEACVADGDEGLAWGYRPMSEALLPEALREIVASLPQGYYSEYNSSVKPWLSSMSEVLAQGAAFLIDYGFPRHEYYHDQRNSGTLMCHYRHRSHSDPLILPGLQDITAHVDFTAVAEAAVESGFNVSGFTSQAQFLLSLGLTDMLTEVPRDDLQRQMVLAQEVKKLTMPHEMGELFKVIGLNKNIDISPRGFMMNDQRARL